LRWIAVLRALSPASTITPATNELATILCNITGRSSTRNGGWVVETNVEASTWPTTFEFWIQNHNQQNGDK
jgi:hypothetical protein